MRRGFSLVEVLVALLLFQVGILATASMALLAQRHLTRAELTLRGTLEARWIADSLLSQGGEGPEKPGTASFSWGEVRWFPVTLGRRGLRVVATRRGSRDTLAVLHEWAHLADTLLLDPVEEESDP
jgi:prepilin-type N-terminal cleavage/methylation domain-containing protein